MRIVSLGEVLWDVFPDETRFGGAPANFACHAAAHGAASTMISRVGTDVLGDQALAELQSHKVDVSHVQRDGSLPTGVVTVVLDHQGVPGYNIIENVAWDELEPTNAMETLAGQVNAVYFGTLGQRCECSRQTILQFLCMVPSSTLRVYDVNLRAPYLDEQIVRVSLQSANIVKLSDEELDFVTKITGIQGDVMTRLEALRERYQLKLIALTRGADGAILMTGNETSVLEGIPTEVKDTVGAGDSFTATMVTGFLRGEPLHAINEKASRVAAYVCSKMGAIPSLPAGLAW
ncbi:MAG: Ribokinase [Verrucomicrobiota bacterium]|jgi:fructokinase